MKHQRVIWFKPFNLTHVLLWVIFPLKRNDQFGTRCWIWMRSMIRQQTAQSIAITIISFVTDLPKTDINLSVVWSLFFYLNHLTVIGMACEFSYTLISYDGIWFKWVIVGVETSENTYWILLMPREENQMFLFEACLLLQLSAASC